MVDDIVRLMRVNASVLHMYNHVEDVKWKLLGKLDQAKTQLFSLD